MATSARVRVGHLLECFARRYPDRNIGNDDVGGRRRKLDAQHVARDKRPAVRSPVGLDSRVRPDDSALRQDPCPPGITELQSVQTVLERLSDRDVVVRSKGVAADRVVGREQLTHRAAVAHHVCDERLGLGPHVCGHARKAGIVFGGTGPFEVAAVISEVIDAQIGVEEVEHHCVRARVGEHFADRRSNALLGVEPTLICERPELWGRTLVPKQQRQSHRQLPPGQTTQFGVVGLLAHLDAVQELRALQREREHLRVSVGRRPRVAIPIRRRAHQPEKHLQLVLGRLTLEQDRQHAAHVLLDTGLVCACRDTHDLRSRSLGKRVIGVHTGGIGRKIVGRKQPVGGVGGNEVERHLVGRRPECLLHHPDQLVAAQQLHR